MTQSDRDAVLPDDRERDDEILHLRESGHGYLAIADQLGLTRATMARSGYLRALGRLPPDQQSASCLRELERLDSLANHIAAREDLDEPEIAHRLLMVDRMRRDLVDSDGLRAHQRDGADAHPSE